MKTAEATTPGAETSASAPTVIVAPPTCAGCGLEAGPASRCEHCGAAHRAGRYAVVRVVSQGPHGRVYEAVGPGGERVALKELIFALVPDAAALDAFDREAKLLQALSHPQIPRLLDAFREGSGVHTRLYLAQEFVEGQSLQEAIAREPLNSEEARRLGKQVLRLLDALHGRDPPVLHRDIKPANLILRPDGLVSLVDFGSARLLPRGVTHGATLVGTFGYMPPEQLGGTVDESSDVYAVGATLMHALTGRPPEELTRDGLRLDVDQHLGHVEPGLRRVIKKMVAPNRADRFQSAREALSALSSLRGGVRDALAGFFSGGERRKAVVAVVLWAVMGLAWWPLVSPPPPRPRPPPFVPAAVVPFTQIEAKGQWGISVTQVPSSSPLASGIGAIHVFTTPPGAHVLLDGVPQEKRTPVGGAYALRVGSGSHRVKFFLDTGEAADLKVRVDPGQVSVIRAYLPSRAAASSPDPGEWSTTVQTLPTWIKLERDMGAISVVTDPPGASVMLDGVLVDGRSPIMGEDALRAAPGEHEVKFIQAGRVGGQSIQVVAGQITVVRASLGRAAELETLKREIRALQAASSGAVGKLALSTREAGLEVIVDGKPTGRTSPIPIAKPLELPVGRHVVQFKRDGKLSKHVHVTVQPGEVVTLRNLPAD